MSSTLCKLADVVGTEAIDILLIGDGGRDVVLGNVFRDRQLNKDTVDCGVVIQAFDLLEKLDLGGGIRKVDEFAADACLGHMSKKFLVGDL